MMKASAVLALAFWGLCVKSATTPKCNADNCARAVTGTALLAKPTLSSRLADCSSYQQCTLIPALTTTLTNCPTAIPSYASACTSGATSRYASACSCAGVAKTSTVSTPITLPTLFSSFAIISGKGPTAKFVDLVDDPDDGPLNPGQVLQILPAGVFPRQTFKLDGSVLEVNDGTFRHADTFYDDDFSSNVIQISAIYFNTADEVDTLASLNFPPAEPYTVLQCYFGAYDISVPGYPLSCLEPHQGLTTFFKSDNNVISLGHSDECCQHPIDPLYAVSLPGLS